MFLTEKELYYFCPPFPPSSPSQLPSFKFLLFPSSQSQVENRFSFNSVCYAHYIYPDEFIFVACMYVVSRLTTVHWTNMQLLVKKKISGLENNPIGCNFVFYVIKVNDSSISWDNMLIATFLGSLHLKSLCCNIRPIYKHWLASA